MKAFRSASTVAWVVVVLLASAASARAEEKIHLLVIGNNNAFAEERTLAEKAPLPALRFADDDAVAFYELLAGASESAHLLTLMDTDTEARYPQLATVARPPTLGDVRAAVADIARRIEADRARDQRSVVYIFFSGHGAIEDGRGPILALLDGGISHAVLYDEILAKLPADYVHLFIDACHAEAVVRPRDTVAGAVPVSAREANALLVHSTLARFPHVGTIVAASTDTRAHEWDLLGQGVFTHELLSALRGAADVNHDGVIEYSEIYAFLGAANRGIDDPRARPSVVARPPDIDRRVAVLRLSRLSPAGTVQLRGVPAAGLVRVDDGLGQRLVTLHGESGFVADLYVPAGTTYVQIGDREARFEARAGEVVPFRDLAFQGAGTRSRGALEQSVRRGLFATEFGRGYYSGFIDQAPDFVPVSFAEVETVRTEPPSREVHRTAVPFAGRLVAGLGASNTVAREFGASGALRLGRRPAGSRGLVISLDLARASGANMDEVRFTPVVGWLWSVPVGPARVWMSATAGGGFIRQSALGEAVRWSGVVKVGPSLGVATDVTHRFGIWAEGELAAMAYRREDRAALLFAPSLLGGVSFAL